MVTTNKKLVFSVNKAGVPITTPSFTRLKKLPFWLTLDEILGMFL
jgi:hypothetical protein